MITSPIVAPLTVNVWNNCFIPFENTEIKIHHLGLSIYICYLIFFNKLTFLFVHCKLQSVMSVLNLSKVQQINATL